MDWRKLEMERALRGERKIFGVEHGMNEWRFINDDGCGVQVHR